MFFRPVAQINKEALLHNLAMAKKCSPSSKIIAMVKANAYGHGAIEITSTLKKYVDAFAVARLDEALQLYNHGIDNAVIIMDGFSSLENLETIIQRRFSIVIYERNQVELLLSLDKSHSVDIWLMLDTGMNRLGFTDSDFIWAYMSLSNKKFKVKIMSHFSCADSIDSSFTKQQISKFNSLTSHLECEKSLANSAALFNCPQTHLDWIRPGIMLYGVNPFYDYPKWFEQLKPVMTLKTNVFSIRFVSKGDFVGYGCTWQAKTDTNLAVVSIGYGDGYPRSFIDKVPVLIRDKIYFIVGRISMDMLTVDIGNDSIEIGDEVTLWGNGLRIEDVANSFGTIPYELLCKLTSRVRFEYTNSDK